MLTHTQRAVDNNTTVIVNYLKSSNLKENIMAEEQKLEIVPNGEYNNITLKTRVNKSTGQVSQGLTAGNYITVTKEGYDEARLIDKGSYNLYSCNVEYDGEVVSFLLNRDDEGEDWNACGGIGDKIKITAVSKSYKFKGESKTRLGLAFELVA